MMRISPLKLALAAVLGATTLLGACSTLHRDSLFENTGPRPAEATDPSQPFGAPAAAMRPNAVERHP